MMKKKLVGLTLCIVLLTVPNLAYANSSEVLKQAPDVFSEENLMEVELLKEKVEQYMNAKYNADTDGIEQKNRDIETRAVADSKYLDVPLLKQSNSYYCGPACARMTLKYLGVDKSQSTLANEMGTTSADGTYVYKMVNCLNNRLGGTKYKYILNSQLTFGEGLVYSIDKNRPVICHVMTGGLPNYASTGHNTGHYITARGYKYYASGGTGSDYVYYCDPNNNSEYYGKTNTTWKIMRNAINANAGYYIMSN